MNGEGVVDKMKLATAALGLAGALAISQAQAQSPGNSEEIALLKQQLRLLEEKLDKLQKQSEANAVAAARAKTEAKTEAKAEARSEVKREIANANAALPVKGPVPPPSGVV